MGVPAKSASGSSKEVASGSTSSAIGSCPARKRTDEDGQRHQKPVHVMLWSGWEIRRDGSERRAVDTGTPPRKEETKQQRQYEDDYQRRSHNQSSRLSTAEGRRESLARSQRISSVVNTGLRSSSPCSGHQEVCSTGWRRRVRVRVRQRSQRDKSELSPRMAYFTGLRVYQKPVTQPPDRPTQSTFRNL